MQRCSRFVLAALLLLAVAAGSAYAEAIVTVGSTESELTILPIVTIHTSIDIQDQVVTTIVDETFFNNTEDSTAKYNYNLPPRASITGFGIWHDGAVHYFDLAPSPDDTTGHTPGPGTPNTLRDFLGPNPFVAPLFSLPSGTFTIRIEYSELMDYNFGMYSTEYPLGNSVFLNGNIDSIHVDLQIHSQRNILNLQLDNYPMTLTYQNTDSAAATYEARYSHPMENLDIQLQVSQEDVGMWVMAHKDSTDEQGYFLAILEPGDVTPGEISHKTFTFVLDRSGSMSGTKIVQAKQAAVYCIQHLQPGDFFNIITFDDHVTPWNTEPLPVNENNVTDAANFINNINAAANTNLNGAMIAALTQEMGDQTANQILLISDGLPTAGVTDIPHILSNIQEANTHQVSIFTVGVGPSSESNLDFLHMIALQNRGLYLDIAKDRTSPV